MNTYRRKQIQAMLFLYAKYKDEVNDYFAGSSKITPSISETGGIRGSLHSDPTANEGIALAEPPKHIKRKQLWCEVIENAWMDISVLDGFKEDGGRAYVMEKYFCLTGKPREKEKNDEARDALIKECKISRSTFFRWMNDIIESVDYYARIFMKSRLK